MKFCKKCNKWKDESEFDKSFDNRRNKSYLRYICKSCRRPQTQRGFDQMRFGGNRIKVLKRDNHICQICGNYGNLVHHKDGSGIRSKYSTALFPNNSPENLIAVCLTCHTRLHLTKKSDRLAGTSRGDALKKLKV